MDYYKEIKNELVNNEVYRRVKDYSKNRHELEVYYRVGKLLSEAGKHYGDGIIKKYASKLLLDVDKKYNERTLRRIRQFYIVFKDENWSSLTTNLTWSHYVELLPIKNIDKIYYYINISIKQNLSYRKLREKIKSN